MKNSKNILIAVLSVLLVIQYYFSNSYFIRANTATDLESMQHSYAALERSMNEIKESLNRYTDRVTHLQEKNSGNYAINLVDEKTTAESNNTHDCKTDKMEKTPALTSSLSDLDIQLSRQNILDSINSTETTLGSILTSADFKALPLGDQAVIQEEIVRRVNSGEIDVQSFVIGN